MAGVSGASGCRVSSQIAHNPIVNMVREDDFVTLRNCWLFFIYLFIDFFCEQCWRWRGRGWG